MSDAATAITAYIGVLSWAQRQAGDAIDMWDSGDHAGAQEVLNTARTQLKQAAGTLSTRLGKLSGGAPDSPSWLTQARELAKDLGLGKSSGGKELWQYGNNPADRNKRGWGHQAPDATGGDPNAAKKTSWSVKIAEVSAGADVWSKDAKGEVTVGGAKLSASGGVALLGLDSSVAAGITDGNLELKAATSAYLAKAEVSGSAEYSVVSVQAQGGARAGGNAEAKATIGKDGLHAGAEAFGGGKVEGSGSGDVCGIGAGVTGEGWVGAGAAVGIDAGKDKDGRYHVGGEVGAGVGLGGKVGFQATVDPSEVIDTVEDAADAVGDTTDSAWDHTLGKLF